MDREAVIKRLTAMQRRVDTLDSWVIDNAISLLKEREAVKPVVAGDGELTWWYGCGACHAGIDPRDPYCRRCGRAVKWQ